MKQRLVDISNPGTGRFEVTYREPPRLAPKWYREAVERGETQEYAMHEGGPYFAVVHSEEFKAHPTECYARFRSSDSESAIAVCAALNAVFGNDQ